MPKNKNANTQGIDTIKLQKQLAEQGKMIELLTSTLKSSSTVQLTKEELAEVYDPANPQAVVDALAKKQEEHNKNFNKTLDELKSKAVSYAEEKFSDSKITTREALASWSKDNNIDELDYDTLIDSIPPKLAKKLESGEDITKVLDEAKAFLVPNNSNSSTTNLPANRSNGSAGGTKQDATNAEQDGEGLLL